MPLDVGNRGSNRPLFFIALGQEAGGRRQEAEGRRQEAGGRRQKAGGRRQKAGGRRQKAVLMKKIFHHHT
ncbi:MAG: hypothetical protein F6J92_06605 [Symploca sp. SIO1A3]|nr:hypothetical protein [Symploca sp. SIO1A3]